MHPNSSRVFQRYQECVMKRCNLEDLSVTKQNKLPFSINRCIIFLWLVLLLFYVYFLNIDCSGKRIWQIFLCVYKQSKFFLCWRNWCKEKSFFIVSVHLVDSQKKTKLYEKQSLEANKVVWLRRFLHTTTTTTLKLLYRAEEIIRN